MLWEIVAEQNPKPLKWPLGASSSLFAGKGEVDEFPKRRRTALEGFEGPQNCFIFPLSKTFGKIRVTGYNAGNNATRGTT